MSKKLKFEGYLAELLQKMCLLRQFRQSICNKIEKLSKVGHDKKSLIFTFSMCLQP